MNSERLFQTLHARPARLAWIVPAVVALVAGVLLMGGERGTPAELQPTVAMVHSAAAGFIDHSMLNRPDLAAEPEPSPMSVAAREE